MMVIKQMTYKHIKTKNVKTIQNNQPKHFDFWWSLQKRHAAKLTINLPAI